MVSHRPAIVDYAVRLKRMVKSTDPRRRRTTRTLMIIKITSCGEVVSKSRDPIPAFPLTALGAVYRKLTLFDSSQQK